MALKSTTIGHIIGLITRLRYLFSVIFVQIPIYRFSYYDGYVIAGAYVNIDASSAKIK